MNKAKPPANFDENPEWTEADFAKAKSADQVHGELVAGKLVKRIGRPPGRTKERVTIRLDKDLVEKLRATGRGWQTRVNDMLREAVD